MTELHDPFASMAVSDSLQYFASQYMVETGPVMILVVTAFQRGVVRADRQVYLHLMYIHEVNLLPDRLEQRY